MRLSEWVKLQIDALRSIIVAEDPPPVPPDGVDESHNGNEVVLRFQSRPANLSRARKAIEKFCETTPLDQPARDEIGLVVNEALANVMRHAYENAHDQPIEMRVEPYHAGICLKIRDWGNGKDPTEGFKKPKDPLVPGGLGLICLQKLTDGIKFTPQHDGMLLELIRTTPGSKAAAVDGDERKGEARG
jgi:anti-sigma regulatory factor (Ser/Thr protein kinase)